MSATTLPYNLRTNKAVDRSIFMEFLMKMNAYKPIEQYTYIGFGATHMEDFKLVHSLFGISDLISIEMDSSIFQRQKFNKPINCIQLNNCTSGTFIDEYDFDNNCIIWLDYVVPRQLSEQIREFQSLIKKCGAYDLIKISVNANPDALGNFENGVSRQITFEKRLEKLKSRIGQFLDESVSPEDMTKDRLPGVLAKALLNAANDINRRSHLQFYPVSSFAYTDVNHQMLTLSGILLEKDSEFLSKIELEKWPYYYGTDRKIHKINLPDLTFKERLIIDSLLPCQDTEEITTQLDYKGITSFEQDLMNYIQYYRHFPSFSKVIL
ncbi:O-methyltransferase [Domibacillus sp.]|uniref:O-methyltransferase n=1 Tax=Domibacillus sp. TaxID=1969783 RepID=UPI0028110D44|nr:O-methyltransferase [Domibacillus sp.]